MANMSSLFSKKCADIFGKILQVLIILAIAAFVSSLYISLGIEQKNLMIILIIVYILFLIAEFCSTTASFLCHKTNENGIKILMQNLVKTHPVVEFHCEWKQEQ